MLAERVKKYQTHLVGVVAVSFSMYLGHVSGQEKLPPFPQASEDEKNEFELIAYKDMELTKALNELNGAKNKLIKKYESATDRAAKARHIGKVSWDFQKQEFAMVDSSTKK